MSGAQGPMRVSIGGARGSFSDEAAAALFGGEAERLGFSSFAAALEALKQGQAESCVLPLENASVGPVPEVHALLLEESTPLLVAEHVLPIHHQLLGVPGASLTGLKQVTSHPMALAQCAGFLARHHLQAVPGADTAGCAEALARAGGPLETAVIASRPCAALYGLQVLAENIEDLAGNATRFGVFGRTPPPRAQAASRSSSKWMLALWPQGGAAGLEPLMAHWRTLGFELTRLVSRPGGGLWSPVYFVDLVHEANASFQTLEERLRLEVDRYRLLGHCAVDRAR